MMWFTYNEQKPVDDGWYETRIVVRGDDGWPTPIKEFNRQLWWDGTQFLKINPSPKPVSVGEDKVLEWSAILDSENTSDPYIKTKYIVTCYQYNPFYGDNRVCQCGHNYERHFDSHEDMYPCGCKYCECDTFMEATPEQLNPED